MCYNGFGGSKMELTEYNGETYLHLKRGEKLDYLGLDMLRRHAVDNKVYVLIDTQTEVHSRNCNKQPELLKHFLNYIAVPSTCLANIKAVDYDFIGFFENIARYLVTYDVSEIASFVFRPIDEFEYVMENAGICALEKMAQKYGKFIQDTNNFNFHCYFAGESARDAIEKISTITNNFGFDGEAIVNKLITLIKKEDLGKKVANASSAEVTQLERYFVFFACNGEDLYQKEDQYDYFLTEE